MMTPSPVSRWTRLGGRAIASTVGAYAVVSAAFLLVAFTPRGKQIVQGSVLDAYLAWLADLTTLDWGYSRIGREPVFDAIATAAPHTLKYLVPGVAIAVVVGVAVGTYAALRPDSRVDRTASTLAYLGFGVPNFVVVAIVVLAFAVHPLEAEAVYDDSLVQRVLWPASLVATTLLASQFRYARAQSREHAGTDFVRLLRAKGARTSGVAHHVVRNAAVPLVSGFSVDTFAVLLLNVVESRFSIPGIGHLSFLAFWQRDIPTILGTTVLFVFLGFAGNFLQDAAYTVLDPRVDSE
jgi:peptide/nickel transport system permease protein